MKICFLSMEYPPYPSYIAPGGVGTHTYNLAKALAERGHEIHVIACGNFETNEIIDGIHVHRIKSVPLSTLRLPIYSFKASIKLRQLYQFKRFDIIHNQSPYGFFESFLKFFSKRPSLVTTFHGVPLGEIRSYTQRSIGSLNSFLEAFSLLIYLMLNLPEYIRSSKIITVSSNIKYELTRIIRIPKQKLSVIYNGVDTIRFNPGLNKQIIRKRYNLNNNTAIILYVGRLEIRKGIRIFLESAKLLIRKDPNVRFIVVGSGSQSDNLVAIAKELGDHVIFTGRALDEDLPLFYAAADIVVLPSLYEGFPCTLLEAMASGKPIITTNIPSISELVGENCAITVRPNDAKKLQEAIYALLSNDEYQRVLSSNARFRVTQFFTWKQVAISTESVYKEAINQT